MADTTGQPRVAVVGVGLWGRNHARNYAEIGCLAAMVDRHPGTAHTLSAAHGAPVRTFDEVIADPAIEAVVLALPPSQNLPLGLRALAAGKHLFVEKPMALTTGEAEELLQGAERHGRCLMVGHILRYHPAFRRLAEIVRAGELGPILRIVSTRLDLGRIRREEDALWALAPHDVSMILGLAGREPARVRARGGWHSHPAIADWTTVDLTFLDGIRAEIRVSWLHPVKEQRLVVIGRKAMAVFDDREPWDSKLVLYRHGFGDRLGIAYTQRADPEPVPLEPGEPLRLECLHFLDCVRTGRTPLTDGHEGIRVLRVLERATQALDADAAETDRSSKLDSSAGLFLP